ncbi:HEPN domain-containing protein, partial [Oscillospiraceae bacterium OttesenSCG-928-G22]|nr:HEPN domain-containing protein [Oscillospiraceae bacterium OttesenSCG-928-G22]
MSARRNSGADTDSRRYYEWLDKAQADLQTARILLSAGASPASVVFHCHQVAEKALKGYLLYRENRHYDGHNITFLVRRAIKRDRAFAPFLEESPPFNRYYIETRYPTDLPFHIDADDIRDAFSMAEELYRLVAHKIFENLKA